MKKVLGCIKGRSFLTLDDINDEEMLALLDLASRLKEKKKAGIKGNLLEGKHIAMVFEKLSTRTRCATAVAVFDEGGRTEYLGKTDIHLGKKESIKDTARVLGRMFDGIMFRGFSQFAVECFAKYSGVPVWNGLTDTDHPTQALADLMTIKENFGNLKGLKVVYIGDGRNNVATSLLIACAKAGINFVDCTPSELMPPDEIIQHATCIANKNNCTIKVTSDIPSAVAGANVIYTDVWISMGEESESKRRINLLTPYQVTSDVMRMTGNLERGRVIFLHCLPAFHNKETEFSRETGALEVTDEVFEASYSRVFDQAENRVHTIKAVIVASLCGENSIGE